MNQAYGAISIPSLHTTPPKNPVSNYKVFTPLSGGNETNTKNDTEVYVIGTDLYFNTTQLQSHFIVIYWEYEGIIKGHPYDSSSYIVMLLNVACPELVQLPFTNNVYEFNKTFP